MRIGIDATSLVKIQPTGVEKATRDLIRALVSVNTDHELILYTQTPIKEAWVNSAAVKNKVIGSKPIWTQTALPKAAKEDNLDLFWSPSNMLPILVKCKTVVTIHDLAFVRFPNIYSSRDKILSNLTLEIAKQKKSHIIAVSNSTKEDAMKYFKIPENRISIIYNALSDNWQHKLQHAAVEEKGSYVLFVGRIEERKNIANMLRAFKKVSGQFPNVKLILVGKQTKYFKQAQNLTKELGLESKVEYRGYVKEDGLSPLFKNSKLILFPTLYEGFGIPILEGFAAGSPVITSKFGATAEIAEEAAVLVNPHNVGDIAHAMAQLLSSQSLREEYIAKGKERLKYFSWDASAKKLLLTFEQI